MNLIRLSRGDVETVTVPDLMAALMREAVADILDARTGVRPTFDGPERAPERERAGRA